ncbi:MAG: pyridoxal-phosphate dependent enzyme, partial [Polyangiaceae bacterium]
KLEWLLGRAKADGRHTVITFGGVGSHHALATSVYAPQHGLRAVLMLLPQPRSPEVREVLLASHARGAELVMAGSMKRARRLAEARRAADPDGVMIVAAGGSEPLGNVGFVSAGIELAEQIDRGELPEPDVVYLALGTMGSAIGLDIGLVAAGRPLPIVAVRASSRPISTWKKLSRMHAETVAYVRKRDPSFPEVRLDPARFVVEDRFLGKGYAEPTVAGRHALELGTEHDVSLELTYTAKAFAALRAAAGSHLKGKRVLFWQSHAARRLDVSEVEPTALPAAFRGWVVK